MKTTQKIVNNLINENIYSRKHVKGQQDKIVDIWRDNHFMWK